MNYSFPVITHVDQVLEAVKGRDEFVVKTDHMNGLIIVNYLIVLENTFPIINNENDKILRECRGITFCSKTGRVLNRKYHKFFNISERAETMHNLIDFTKKHLILEKLDGSMITPLIINNDIKWCTKMGTTLIAEQINEFTSNKNQTHYNDFAYKILNMNMTPIFEWCSRSQRIVIDYPIDRLVLTAIRHNENGEYMSYDEMVTLANNNNIEVVNSLPGSVDNIKEFMYRVNDLKGQEGYVIRFEDGHMVKIKGAEYILIHKLLENIKFEKDIIRIIINNAFDDAISLLPDSVVNSIEKFTSDFYKNVVNTTTDLYDLVKESYTLLNGSKKRFAIEVVNTTENKKYSDLLFKIWDNLEKGQDGVKELILETIAKNLGSQTKVNNIRYLFGDIKWKEYLEHNFE